MQLLVLLLSLLAVVSAYDWTTGGKRGNGGGRGQRRNAGGSVGYGPIVPTIRHNNYYNY